ncbi:hypothetical protein [Modestobacter altitudinis]|uniref:hypothetical protein n=1 Tax=Modestobacter altitudinis TaxID=2213158 RepID=UPI00110C9597|nr:hypothetical protein [Modestobacter altitudinis]
MSGYQTAAWSDFSVAVVGASAALTGLLFVAVSINVEQILAGDALTGRSVNALLLFLVPLVVGTLLLVPDQPRAAVGTELVLTGAAAGGWLLRMNRPGNRGSLEPLLSWVLIRLLPSTTIAAGLLAAGVSLLAGAGGGLYWVVPVVLVAFLGGLATAWVLLVEVRR